MTDLIYGGMQYTDELRELFPGATIKDASDDIHEGRVSISVDMDDWEYLRIVMLNGFFALSLSAQLKARNPEEAKEFIKRFEQWRRDYPEYFEEANHD